MEGKGSEELLKYLNFIKDDNWRKHVRESLPDHHGTNFCLFNYPTFAGNVYNTSVDEDVYVYACYSPAGRH
jgi:hypothetical protein